MSPPPAEPKRNQTRARRVAQHHYSYPAAVCAGKTVGEQIAHFRSQSGKTTIPTILLGCATTIIGCLI